MSHRCHAQKKETHMDEHTLRLLEEYYASRLVSAQGPKLWPFYRVLSKIQHNGVWYHCSQSSIRNSFVVIGSGIPGPWFAGQIEQIFTHRLQDRNMCNTFILLRKFKELTEEHQSLDWYRRYPFIGGRLFYDIMEDDVVLLPCITILCHFAHTRRYIQRLGTYCVHALPLDRDVSISR